MDPVKLKAINDWEPPRTVKQVQAFLGFANFYRHFIRDFASISRPLHDLTKKDRKWEWGPKEQEAFDHLRKAFVTAPVLSLWQPERRTRLEVDASGSTTRGVLCSCFRVVSGTP